MGILKSAHWTLSWREGVSAMNDRIGSENLYLGKNYFRHEHLPKTNMVQRKKGNGKQCKWHILVVWNIIKQIVDTKVVERLRSNTTNHMVCTADRSWGEFKRNQKEDQESWKCEAQLDRKLTHSLSSHLFMMLYQQKILHQVHMRINQGLQEGFMECSEYLVIQYLVEGIESFYKDLSAFVG